MNCQKIHRACDGWVISFWTGLLLVFFFSSVFSAPQVDGLFYMTGEDAIYTKIAEADGGRGEVWFYQDGDMLYFAVIVDPSVNDNVFDDKTATSGYVESVGWGDIIGHHQASDLIKSDNSEFIFWCEGYSCQWMQGLVYDDNGTWKSGVGDDSFGYGPGPDGLETASSTAWNFENSAWNWNPDNDTKFYKTCVSPYGSTPSPYDCGYDELFWDEIIDEVHYQWEWPLVYEMSFPHPCPGKPFNFQVVSAHNSPAKDNIPDIPVAFWDFGDAPDPDYPTLLASSGARHKIIVDGPYLGAKVDFEVDGQPNSTATGDDNNGDDEDGVTFTSALIPGSSATIDVQAQVTGTESAYLNGWIDFNQDGDWDDTGEQIVINAEFLTGTTTTGLSYTVPGGAAEGITYARFRFSTVSGLTPSGPADDGEVEDYLVEVGSATYGMIGDYVWWDKDGEGDQDEKDAGIEGVKLYLLNALGEKLDSTETNAVGWYLFTEDGSGNPLQAGSYIVDVYNRDDDLKNPDGCPVNEWMSLTTHYDPIHVTLGNGNPMVYLDADFGFNCCDGEIGDYTWWDNDKSGWPPDPNERPLPWVIVNLYKDITPGEDADPYDPDPNKWYHVATAQTDIQGYYCFTHCSAGHYKVVTDASGPSTPDDDIENIVDVTYLLPGSGGLLKSSNPAPVRLGMIVEGWWEGYDWELTDAPVRETRIPANGVNYDEDFPYDWDPIAINLVGFNAAPSELGIELTWQMGDIKTTAGFNIHRSEDARSFVKINSSLILISSVPNASYSYIDELDQGGTYYYKLEQVDIVGNSILHGPVSVTFSSDVETEKFVPEEFALLQNYPNPFNPTTTVTFDVPTESWVTMEIYSIQGRRIRTLVSESYTAGRHSVMWNGTDEFGQHVSSGAFVVRMTAGDFVDTIKMVLLR